MRTTRLVFLGFMILLSAIPRVTGQGTKKPDEPIKDKKLAGLVKDFKNKNPKNRAAAVTELLQMAEVRPSDVKQAIPHVFPLLKDTDPVVRRAAITVLDTLDVEPAQFAAPLVELLKKEKDPAVRLAAVTAVKNVGPPARAAAPTLEAILKQVKDNPKEKVLAAEVSAALKQINKK